MTFLKWSIPLLMSHRKGGSIWIYTYPQQAIWQARFSRLNYVDHSICEVCRSEEVWPVSQQISLFVASLPKTPYTLDETQRNWTQNLKHSNSSSFSKICLPQKACLTQSMKANSRNAFTCGDRGMIYPNLGSLLSPDRFSREQPYGMIFCDPRIHMTSSHEIEESTERRKC